MTVHHNLNEIVKAERAGIEDLFSLQVDRLARLAHDFDLPTVEQAVRVQGVRLSTEQFTLMVAGRFKVGKSTFLNALLSSTATGQALRDMPLPMDDLPCTPVLTRIDYAPEPRVVARRFDGQEEIWSLEEYADFARLCPDKEEKVLGKAGKSPIDEISSFDVGLPADLLKTGLVLIDSPGISEDPRRTALTRAALSNVDAGVVMFRNSPFGGTDEIEFAAEVARDAGHVFAAVNMFNGEVPNERLRLHVDKKLSGILAGELSGKVDPKVYFVDCAKALNGYVNDDADRIRASGIRELETRIGQFLLTGAYQAKVGAAVTNVRKQMSFIDEEVSRRRNAYQADRETLVAALGQCEADMANIKTRRDTIASVLEQTIEKAKSAAERSYKRMCGDLAGSIEWRFRQRPITSLQGVTGKVASLVTGSAAKEATAILVDTMETFVREWAQAAPSENGLQRDILPVIEDGQRRILAEYDGIEARLRNISLTINSLGSLAQADAGFISLQDRLISAGLGVVLLGPIGLAGAMGGWRSIVGATLGAIAINAALGFIAGAFGVIFAPAALIIVAIAAALGGGLWGGVFNLEERVRQSALDAVRPRLLQMAGDENAQQELFGALVSTMEEDANSILTTLDSVLAQQESSLSAIEAINSQDLEEKERDLRALENAAAVLESIDQVLIDLQDSAVTDKAA